MTKTLLLLLALYGLGDDDFRVRQASERYLAASGYVVVPLNQLAPHLATDLQTKATLKKLEKRYYGAWGAKLDRNLWHEYPSLAALSPWNRLYPYPATLLDNHNEAVDDDPLYPFVRHYMRKAVASQAALGPLTLQVARAVGNGATRELLSDVRSRGAPAWAGRSLLGYLQWRAAALERRYGVKDPWWTNR
jgi:hypothetical protein